jgi:agmatinase
MRNYAGIEDKYAQYRTSAIILQSIPYDGTSTWGKGADNGFEAFLEASENMELYDIETDTEVYKEGVYINPPIHEDSSPEAMTESVFNKTMELLETDKFLTFFGGEHSVSIGIIKAYKEKYNNLTVLQLDAHADLRESYLGSRCNHACALHEASKTTNLIQVGIRSMDVCELEHLNKKKCFFAHKLDNQHWMDKAIEMMGENVYLTIDLDVLDPSIMPATGTPEPGGLDWYTLIKFLKLVFINKNVVGFDIVELAPLENNKAPQFLVAKLYYKLLSYKFRF